MLFFDGSFPKIFPTRRKGRDKTYPTSLSLSRPISTVRKHERNGIHKPQVAITRRISAESRAWSFNFRIIIPDLRQWFLTLNTVGLHIFSSSEKCFLDNWSCFDNNMLLYICEIYRERKNSNHFESMFCEINYIYSWYIFLVSYPLWFLYIILNNLSNYNFSSRRYIFLNYCKTITEKNFASPRYHQDFR